MLVKGAPVGGDVWGYFLSTPLRINGMTCGIMTWKHFLHYWPLVINLSLAMWMCFRPCDVAPMNLYHAPILLIFSIKCQIDHVSDFVCAVATQFGAVYNECFIHIHGIIIVHYFKINIRNHSACEFYVVLLYATIWCRMRTLSRRCWQGK